MHHKFGDNVILYLDSDCIELDDNLLNNYYRDKLGIKYIIKNTDIVDNIIKLNNKTKFVISMIDIDSSIKSTNSLINQLEGFRNP